MGIDCGSGGGMGGGGQREKNWNNYNRITIRNLKQKKKILFFPPFKAERAFLFMDCFLLGLIELTFERRERGELLARGAELA